MSARFSFNSISSTQGKLFDEAKRIISSGLIEEAKSAPQKVSCATRLTEITIAVIEAGLSDPEIRAYYAILLIGEKNTVNLAVKEFYAGLMDMLKKQDKHSSALENSHLLVPDKSPEPSSLKPK